MSRTSERAAPALRDACQAGEEELERLGTGDLRRRYLLEDLFRPGEIRAVRTGLDRLTVGGVLPLEPVTIAAGSGRETGVLNLGAGAAVRVDGRRFDVEPLGCVYAGAGASEIAFEPAASGESAFYFASCPAQRTTGAAAIQPGDAETVRLGDSAHANVRTIRKMICPGRLESCQLVMGFTTLDENSIWNTMPPHTHARRSEIYLYFDLGDGFVVHLMGTPDHTRHLIVRDRQAVLSPSWSIHSGAGTRRYSFAWVMAGENQDFGDMDPVPPGDLR